MGVNEDITERKQAEEALRESEKRFRNFLDNLGDAAYETDSSGNVTYANKKVEIIASVPLKDIIGKPFLPLFTAESQKIAIDVYQRTLNGESTDNELTFNNGKICHFKNEPLRDKDGKIIGVFGIARDITERIQAEEALQESEEKYRGIFDESIAAVYLFDEKKNFLDSNQAGLDLLGYSREELLNTSMPDVDADPIVVLPAHEQLLGGERIINYEHRLNRKDGKVITVLSNSRPITDTNGHVIGMQSTLFDITERNEAEKALQKAHDELERRVEERTRELDVQKNSLRFLSSRLIKAQEQERRRVSKGLHDEMGQALAILKLKLRSVQRGFPEGQSSLKEEFDDTAQYIDQIIETVRRLSKDLSPAVLEDLGLSSALEWLIENFGKQHSIRTSVEMVILKHLFSQETQTNLYRIFQEALTNIVKHARAGHVSFVVKKEEKGSVCFFIKDNGKGFDVNEAVAVNITERGMGLTAMNERAYIMGAILDIQSRPGEGTRITLEISA